MCECRGAIPISNDCEGDDSPKRSGLAATSQKDMAIHCIYLRERVKQRGQGNYV